ncbi:PP2C family protein-serine/threonine phosphatase [Actinomadura viridis]
MQGADRGTGRPHAVRDTDRGTGRRPAEPGVQALLDALDDAVIVLDPSGEVVRSNAVARRLLGDLRPGRPPGRRAGAVLRETGPGGVPAGEASGDGEALGARMTARRLPMADGSVTWVLRDVTVEREREDALRLERERKHFLSRASRALSGTLNLRRTWGLAARLTADGPADQCAVTLWSDEGPPITAVARPGGPARFLTAEPAGAGPTRVRATGRREVHPELTPERARELCPPGLDPPSSGSVVLVPLRARGSCFGVMTLLRAEPYDEAELELIDDHADRVALALEAARLYQHAVNTSERLRSALLPPALPPVPGTRLGAVYRAATAGSLIGGDFYEVLHVPAKGWMFVLGDVCGKGVDAAVYTGRVRQALRTAAMVDLTPTQTLDLLNRTLLVGDDGGFVTLVIGSPEPLPDGSVRITLAAGGHPAPLVLRNDGTVEPVRLPGMLVGALQGAVFGDAEVVLEPGDALYLYTDGITEARGEDGAMYGEERLMEDLADCRGMPPGAVVERVAQLALEHLRGGEHDDIAMFGIQAAPAAGWEWAS